MRSRRCDDHQRPFGVLLPAHVGEIDVVSVEFLKSILDLGLDWIQYNLSRQQADCVAQSIDAMDANPFDDDLAPVRRRHDELRDAPPPSPSSRSTERLWRHASFLRSIIRRSSSSPQRAPAIHLGKVHRSGRLEAVRRLGKAAGEVLPMEKIAMRRFAGCK
jgi:hypothetical protein